MGSLNVTVVRMSEGAEEEKRAVGESPVRVAGRVKWRVERQVRAERE